MIIVRGVSWHVAALQFCQTLFFSYKYILSSVSVYFPTTSIPQLLTPSKIDDTTIPSRF